MSRSRAGVLVTLLLAFGVAAYFSLAPGKEKENDDRDGAEQLDPLVLKSLPVEHAEVFQAAGVYSWRWRLGLPHGGDALQFLRLKYTCKDGAKLLLAMGAPTRDQARSGTIELFLVVHFDDRTPMGANRMTASMTYGGMTNRTSIDNPFKCDGSCQNIIKNRADATDGRVVLMTVTKDGDEVPRTLELVVGPEVK